MTLRPSPKGCQSKTSQLGVVADGAAFSGGTVVRTMQTKSPDRGACATCGRQVEPGRGRPRRYCQACVPSGSAAAWRRANPARVAAYNEARRQPKEQRTCEQCGSSFVTGRKATRWCSHACGSAFRWQANKTAAEAASREAYQVNRRVLLRAEAAWLLRAANQLERIHGPNDRSTLHREKAAEVRRQLSAAAAE